jgi:hypothetical protein
MVAVGLWKFDERQSRRPSASFAVAGGYRYGFD